MIRFRDFVTDRLDRLGRFACGLARDRSPGLILAIAVALAFVLRAGFLLLWPVTPHEVHYLREARQVLSAGSVRAMAGSVHAWLPALAYARVLEVFPSADERDLRWIQLAFSLATLGVIHWIGRRAVSPRAGACAAMVFALTPQAIYYGASCEPYSSHLFLTALLLALYASAWRAPSVVGSLAMVTVGTVAIFHHLLAALVLGILAVHALFVNGAPRRTRVLVPVLAGLVVVAAAPMWALGDPGYGTRILFATIPYYFSVDILGWLVTFLAVWDATADRFDPAWPGILALLFVVPVVVFLPHMKLLYVLTGTVPMSLVLGAAVDASRATRWLGAVASYVMLSVLLSMPT